MSVETHPLLWIPIDPLDASQGRWEDLGDSLLLAPDWCDEGVTSTEVLPRDLGVSSAVGDRVDGSASPG